MISRITVLDFPAAEINGRYACAPEWRADKRRYIQDLTSTAKGRQRGRTRRSLRAAGACGLSRGGEEARGMQLRLGTCGLNVRGDVFNRADALGSRDYDNDVDDKTKKAGNRSTRFPEPLFTNRITAMHRDQKLLVMENGPATCRSPPDAPPTKSPPVTPNQCTDKFRITVATRRFPRSRCPRRRKIAGFFRIRNITIYRHCIDYMPEVSIRYVQYVSPCKRVK